MGQSTDAKIFFGFPIEGGEDGTAFWENPGAEAKDWEEFVAAKLGVKSPTAEYSEETKPAYHAYWDAKREAIAKLDVEVVEHCSGDHPLYALAVKTTYTRVCRGDIETFQPDHFYWKEEWFTKLRAFCELVGLEYKEPAWCVCSYWN
jgi:hypothetical protein